MSGSRRAPPLRRPEIDNQVSPAPTDLDIARRSSVERLWANRSVRRAALLLALTSIWEAYAARLGNPLIFPRFTEAVAALWWGLVDGPLMARTMTSMGILLTSYGIGVALAGVLVTAAVSSTLGEDLLGTLAAMFSPLPAIALLPLALLWFGLGQPSLVFVVVFSVVWVVALNALGGFTSVDATLRMSGQNYGLRGIRYVAAILVPAALPSIITGLRIGWSFAWRTIIAAELVFGATSRGGGLGWFIYESRNELDTPSVFAGLLVVVIIGLFVENFVFRLLENRTVRRWGMQS